ncbi:Death ligand signal enhancer [Nibea albiflora]|uniref:Death ligand signal enhancer n=1 Tax=Nibea albiflora TaxID=240163 RepID=A0ACB7EQB3_NIBAL|nr:Death ligand signal enhancer [Nibea albiflora]
MKRRRKQQRTFQYGCAELPHYTALDAVGWSAAAVLFMQFCRRIHSRLSSGTEPSPIPGAQTAPSKLHKCGYRILLQILSQRDVLPRGRSVLCLPEVTERQNQDQLPAHSSSSSSSGGSSLHSSNEQDHLTSDCSGSDQPQIPDETLLSATCPLQNDANRDSTETKEANDKDILSDEERLTEAAQNLKHVEDTSVPVILNIIGLESAKSENYEEAFTCFIAAAQQGYSKAQFNVGVCYEKGRGVRKDKDKALHYYWQAAGGGHRQAQYRYAKLLLTSKGHQSSEELNTAISLLEQSAAAGLTKAQVCLASVYSQEPVRDWEQVCPLPEDGSREWSECPSRCFWSLIYGFIAQDDTALLFLGQCFECGFGVQPNLRTAIEYYKRAAQAGNKQAKSLLTPPNDMPKAEDAMLRSIRSAPCFSVADHWLSSLVTGIPPSTSLPVNLPLLPHSWSTGSLCVSPALSSTPLHLHPCTTEGGTCQWTVGIG